MGGERLAAAVPEAIAVRLLLMVRVVLWRACRVTVRGTLPAGGAVIGSNHVNFLDPVLGVLLDPRRVRPVSKPLPHPAARVAILVTRAFVVGEGVNVAALRHLRRGGCVWLAPEGRMSETGIGRPRTGAARMAVAGGVPLVPLAIRYEQPRGPRLRDWRPWRRPGVELIIGQPLTSAPDADVGALSEQLMHRLAGLLEAA